MRGNVSRLTLDLGGAGETWGRVITRRCRGSTVKKRSDNAAGAKRRTPIKHYSRWCGRNGPRHSLLHAYVGKWQRLSEGREREHLGKIPEREREWKGKKERNSRDTFLLCPKQTPLCPALLRCLQMHINILFIFCWYRSKKRGRKWFFIVYFLSFNYSDL